MNMTELLASVKTPAGRMASVGQLTHARARGLVDPPTGGWDDRHREQLQKYVDRVVVGRPKEGEQDADE